MYLRSGGPPQTLLGERTVLPRTA